MVPRVLQAQEGGAVVSHSVEELDSRQFLSGTVDAGFAYEEPHGCAQACRHESVEGSRGVDVDGVSAGAVAACQSRELMPCQLLEGSSKMAVAPTVGLMVRRRRVACVVGMCSASCAR